MIEKLFTSKTRIKIISFFLFGKNESHIREISRELKISVSAVKREIDNLKSIGLINLDKNKITLNKNCNYLEDLKNLFIKTDYIIYPIKDVLKNEKIRYAFIFGSFARGTYTKDSDIDLMIIGNLDSFNLYKKLKPVENKIKRDINPVVWTLENLKKEKNSGFVKDIFKKGIIMIKGSEYELKRIIE